MITPKQAAASVPDCRATLKEVEKKMDREILGAQYSGHDNAFLIIEDYPEYVQEAIRTELCTKYLAAGWVGATCHPGQHFHVHFTKRSLDERNACFERHKNRNK